MLFPVRIRSFPGSNENASCFEKSEGCNTCSVFRFLVLSRNSASLLLYAVGMACKDDKGEWVLINGNQTCLLFLYYIIKNRIATGKMQPTDFIVKTIVTTELIKAVADKNKIEMLDCYTGFKWIAREIRLSEGKQQYIGGGEESYGFLAEDFVRDKDAVSACSLLAEICAWAKDQCCFKNILSQKIPCGIKH